MSNSLNAQAQFKIGGKTLSFGCVQCGENLQIPITSNENQQECILGNVDHSQNINHYERCTPICNCHLIIKYI